MVSNTNAQAAAADDACTVVTMNWRLRSIDAVLATIGLAATLPLLVLIGAVIAIESRGPLLVRRPGQGRGGRPVAVLAFRVASGKGLTRSGQFLHASDLETMPALWNVILGHLSLADALRRD